MNNEPPEKYPHADITEKVIGCAHRVHRKLGSGFLEKVYENAMVIELEKLGLKVAQQYPLNVVYDGKVIGEYFADLLVEDKVIVELKAVSELAPIHEVQLVNYLRATGIEVGLLINFSENVNVKRRVLAKSKVKLFQY
ncbi:MAG TPA: GxxExxY protein [Syntrophothermus lipocalidus]|nr:GxxExxY protein [Syntrophothermus lipocalidus]